jgi:hypothetical protein
VKRFFWEFVLFVLTLISVVSFILFGCDFVFLVIHQKASAEDFASLILFAVLFLISAYVAGYLYWERKVDDSLYDDLCFLEWASSLIELFLELLGELLVFHVYLYVEYLRMRNKARWITYREYWRERKAERE